MADVTVKDVWTTPGNWSIYIGDISIVHADGTVVPIGHPTPNSLQAMDPAYDTSFNAVVETVPLASDPTAAPGSNHTTKFYLGDQLGSTQLEFTAGGWPIWSERYTPFGQEIAPQPTNNNYKFAGMERDSESNLDHTQFRQYSSALGRWMSPDPYNGSMDLSNPQSLNRYSYASNSPLIFADPSGLNNIKVVDPDDLGGLFTYGNGYSGTSAFGSSWNEFTVLNSYFSGMTAGVTVTVTDPNNDGKFLFGASFPANWNEYGGMLFSLSQAAQFPSGGGTVTAAPNNPEKKNPFICGSEAAGKISAAGGLQKLFPSLNDGVAGFITNAAGGNAFSGLTDLISSFGSGEGGGHSVFYNMGQGVVAGPTQGFGAAFGKSIEGTPFASGPMDAAMGEVLGEYATGVGEAKFLYDGGPTWER